VCLWLGDNIVILSMVKRAQHFNTEILLKVLDRVNVPVLFILNTFHPFSSRYAIFCKWLLYVSQKGPCLHPPMRRRGLECPRLIQLVKRIKKNML
jgi:hypothetical protein